MGFLNSLWDFTVKFAENAQARMIEEQEKIQKYMDRYEHFSDKRLFEELNRQRKEQNSFFSDDPRLRIKALWNLLESRGYYRDAEGKLRKR